LETEDASFLVEGDLAHFFDRSQVICLCVVAVGLEDDWIAALRLLIELVEHRAGVVGLLDLAPLVLDVGDLCTVAEDGRDAVEDLHFKVFEIHDRQIILG